MNIHDITVNAYTSKPTGSISITDSDGTYIKLVLTEEDAHKLLSVGLEFWRKRQPAMAESIAKISTPMLSAPAQDAEFNEVPF